MLNLQKVTEILLRIQNSDNLDSTALKFPIKKVRIEYENDIVLSIIDKEQGE
jgi:hypothetical protein